MLLKRFLTLVQTVACTFVPLTAISIDVNAQELTEIDAPPVSYSADGLLEMFVYPNKDSDGDGIFDFLEVFGFYNDGNVAKPIEHLITSEQWEEFKNKPPSSNSIHKYPTHRWAAEALEEEGYLRYGDNAGEYRLDVSTAYRVIANKFELEGLSPTGYFVTGSPNEADTIANIMSELMHVYPNYIPVVNGKPVQVFYTDPNLFSSDFDPYSDRVEALNLFSQGRPNAPADDPLVGAIPEITATLTDFSLTDIKENRIVNGTSEKHGTVVRQVNTVGESHGLTTKLEVELGLMAPKFKPSISRSTSWKYSTAKSSEQRDSFGTMESLSVVTSENCFSKLKLTVNIANSGSDKASLIRPKLFIKLGDMPGNETWKTLNSDDYIHGLGPSLAVGEIDTQTVFGDNNEAACLTLDEANYLMNGGSISIGTKLENASMSYVDQNTGVVYTGGNWASIKDNFEKNLAKIRLNVITTAGIEIDRTFWVTAYDPNSNLPNMRRSIRDVLEKAYTSVDCASIEYPAKRLCFVTEDNKGYIVLGDTSVSSEFADGKPKLHEETRLDFRFFSGLDGEQLDETSSIAAYKKMSSTLKTNSNRQPLDFYLPKNSSVTIFDATSAKPKFVNTELIMTKNESNSINGIEARAIVSDFSGVSNVEFCFNESTCSPMEAALEDQDEVTVSGYYKYTNPNYVLLGTEFFKATNVNGITTTNEKPQVYYYNLKGYAKETLEKQSKTINTINEWLNYVSDLQRTNPYLYNEIIENNLMSREGIGDITTHRQALEDALENVKQSCGYGGNPMPLEDVVAAQEHQLSCDNAIEAYEQSQVDHKIHLFNPYKVPLRNILKVMDHGYVIPRRGKVPQLKCYLDKLDVVTGMQMNSNYKFPFDVRFGVKFGYRTIIETHNPIEPFKWSAFKTRTCGDWRGGADRKTWDTAEDLEGTKVKAIMDYAFRMKGGNNIYSMCSGVRDYDLRNGKLGAYQTFCDRTSNWGYLEAFSNTQDKIPRRDKDKATAGKQMIFETEVDGNSSNAQLARARHISYEINYAEKPVHLLVDGQAYYFRSKGDDGKDLYLTLEGDQPLTRTVKLKANDGSDNQLWIVEVVNDREFRIKPKSFEGYLTQALSDEADLFVTVSGEDDATSANYYQHWRMDSQALFSSKYKISSVSNFKAVIQAEQNGLELESELSNRPIIWTITSAKESESVKAVEGYSEHIQSSALGFKEVSIDLDRYSGSRGPVVFASMQTTNDDNPAGLRVDVRSKGKFNLLVEEENSKARDARHEVEEVAYLVFEPKNADNDGYIRDVAGEIIGEVGISWLNQTSKWKEGQINFHRHYNNPVVIMMMNSYYGTDPAHVRIKNVSSSSDYVRYSVEEWDYLDQKHNNEKIAYLVVESGKHTLVGGQVLQAFNTTLDTVWKNVGFNSGFSQAPKVFSQSQTFNNSQPIITRQKEIRTNSFKLKLQEEMGNNGWHPIETVGVIAIGQ